MGRKCMAYKCSYLKDDLKIRETNKERVSNDLPEIPPIKLFGIPNPTKYPDQFKEWVRLINRADDLLAKNWTKYWCLCEKHWEPIECEDGIIRVPYEKYNEIYFRMSPDIFPNQNLTGDKPSSCAATPAPKKTKI